MLDPQHCPIVYVEECEVDYIFDWATALVSKENYSDLWKFAVELLDDVMGRCNLPGNVSILSLDLKPDNVNRILREA